MKIKNCCLFAIYDGHGGSACCDKLKEVFHRYLLEDLKQESYESQIVHSCRKFDSDFNHKVKSDPVSKQSGSCALTLLVLGNYLYC